MRNGCLFFSKQRALHELFDQCSNAVAIGFTSVQNRLDGGAVGELDGGSGCVDCELLDEVLGELRFVLE